MKLVGKLKEKVNKAETKEQAKEIIANAGMELTDDEMDKVSGGVGFDGNGTLMMQSMVVQDIIWDVDKRHAEHERQMKQQIDSAVNQYRELD